VVPFVPQIVPHRTPQQVRSAPAQYRSGAKRRHDIARPSEKDMAQRRAGLLSPSGDRGSVSRAAISRPEPGDSDNQRKACFPEVA